MSPARGRSGWSSGFPPPSKPRPVDGGLKARSARGAIGEQWWSQHFLDVLESFAMGSRLTRGKNYARRGQVVSLEVTPGEVKARVQGSRATPYKVSVRLAVFPELVWAKVEVALAEQAIHSARLLAGEMPHDIDDVFAAAGAPLFPQRADDLVMSCSCPDWEVPCKHLAATFYLLAERFDEEPFDILRWRGRDRTPLLHRLRELRSSDVLSSESGAEVSAQSASSRVRVGAMMALADIAVTEGGPVAGSPVDGHFFRGGPVPRLPEQPDVPADLLLRQLPAPGAPLGRAGFVAFLGPLYAAFGTTPEA